MLEVRPCFFCPVDTTDAAPEHVISEALGCKETIPHGVCSGCNHTFGHTFEGVFLNSLVLFRNFFRIPNGEGVVPGVKVIGKIGSEPFDFVISGDGTANIHPHLLRSVTNQTSSEREFRIFTVEDEEKIEEGLRRKHESLIWERLEGKNLLEVIEAQADFGPELLSSNAANRTVAKYALNLLIHYYGYEATFGRFSALVDYIKGATSTARVGVFWNRQLLKRFSFEPPKHLFVIVQDGRTRTATVFIYLFCLLPFAVVVEEPTIRVDSFQTGAIDPYKGEITPLFLGASPGAIDRVPPAFPAPEFEFARALQHLQLGTAAQADLAARTAVAFMRQVADGQPGVPHICYSCKKILSELTPICKHCGNSPIAASAKKRG
jgi:hypothetical protein